MVILSVILFICFAWAYGSSQHTPVELKSYARRIFPKNFKSRPLFGTVVTADRGSGTISLINLSKPWMTRTYKLEENAEPMYFVVVFQRSELWVADRGLSELSILKINREGGIKKIGALPTGNGTFHAMVTQDERVPFPLSWVTCDIDKVTFVHMTIAKRKLLAKIPMPKQLNGLDAKPHDVTSSWRYGFISYIKATNGKGYVGMYDIFDKFRLVKLISMSEDPHVALRGDSALFVAAQGGPNSKGQVLKLSIPDLKILARDDSQPSPHGICVSYDEKFLYVTNIAEGGKQAVIVYRTKNLKRIDCGEITTDVAVPHNPSLTYDQQKLYITNTVGDRGATSEFKIDERGCPIQKSLKTRKTGLLSFGISIISPQQKLQNARKFFT